MKSAFVKFVDAQLEPTEPPEAAALASVRSELDRYRAHLKGAELTEERARGCGGIVLTALRLSLGMGFKKETEEGIRKQIAYVEKLLIDSHES